jgi:hypothetical protein
VVDLAGMHQVVALTLAEIDAIEPVGLQSEGGDRQRLALGAGYLDPTTAAAGMIDAVAYLETTDSSPMPER